MSIAARLQQQTLVDKLLVGSIILVMLFHLFSLTRYPLVFIDEGWLANASWNWLTTGQNFDSIHAGVLDQFGYEWVSRFFVGQTPYVLIFSVLGLGFFQARLVAWIFGCILLFATVQVGRRTYGLTPGLLAALLLALSLPFLQASRWRQDIMLTATIMLALWLALKALKEEKAWAHLGAGLLLGFGLDIHQSVTLFIPALAALYLLHYGRHILFKRGTWLVGIGGAIGIAFFIIVHILPSPETYSTLMSFNFSSGAEAELPITQPATLINSAVRELGRYGFRQNPLDLALIAAGALLLLVRRSAADRVVLVFTGVAFLNFVLFSGNKTNLYAIHLYPLFMLIVAQLLLTMLQQAQQRPVIRTAGAVLLVLLLGLSVFRVGQRVLNSLDYDYYAITNPMRAVIPADARVMGMPMWWFGLADNDFRSSLSLTYYDFYNDYDTREALEQVRPDYIIMDEPQHVLMVDEGQELEPGLNAFKVSRQQFEDFLAQRGEKILTFTDPYHGQFEVYHISWE